MSVRMRHTKGHTRNRRSHHALSEPRLSKCDNCGELHLRHRLCGNCGKYRGRQIIDIGLKIEKKQNKLKRKEKKMEEMGMKKKDEDDKTPFAGRKKEAVREQDQSMLDKSKRLGRTSLDAKELSKRPEK